MDAGLSNLATLKARLLPSSLTGGTTQDNRILQIGRGVAGAFASFCNRDGWLRATGLTTEFTADRGHWIVPRLPLETVTAVDQKDSEADGFVTLGAVNDVVETIDKKSGLVHFGSMLGDAESFVRITYTGGYWWDTTEDSTGVMPSGATALPYDLQEAWLLQCQRTWDTLDKQGANVVSQGGSVSLLGLSLAGLNIPEEIQRMIYRYRRFCVT